MDLRLSNVNLFLLVVNCLIKKFLSMDGKTCYLGNFQFAEIPTPDNRSVGEKSKILGFFCVVLFITFHSETVL